ncbi:response regulator receiver sensor signal transduction histidine kinase [Leptolyngbya sp. Heron Island J]|uniref:ATP-binding protein n=1 Tax=Leptolyngbya sp. Heron Island J TaxID=1385935 RepID=UPI0003B9F1A2|nr:DUF3365 domain-containing protein [Leptolyngbya sp. Heron Island J]ESA35203.1 response regulator receiver sensor signal transduction histidine kinase [Leptolyngbya sp. Heron Island J]
MIRWNLWAKFSLFLFLVWLLVSGSTVALLSQHLNAHAEQAVKERAKIVLTSMQAVRDYTRDHVQPVLKNSVDTGFFVQESIPNFAARTIFTNFQQQDELLEDFLYKEATPNPTNPTDLADAFEADIFGQLRQFVTSEPQGLSGYRFLDDKKLFYMAQPLVMNDVSCLECHGSVSDAPQYLVEMYGDRNGFGWQLNDVVAAQMVYVPADIIFDRGRQNLWTVTKTLLGTLGAFFVGVNLLLWRTVVQPLKILTNTAKSVSSCSIRSEQNAYPQDKHLEKLTLRQDEPGQLARSFQYMIYVLSRREQDLQLAVQERTRSLEQEMRDRKTAQDALQTYSHAMNHDLRNLVMGIANLVQGMIFRASRDTAAPPTQPPSLVIEPKALTMIQHSCDRQLKLMNSLMEVQASDVWRISLQPDSINLRHLTEDLRLFYESKHVAPAATLDNQVSSSLPLICGDFCQLRRVFENLIDNALKYNPDGVKVTLRACVWAQDTSMVRCAVIDNGVGIDPANSQTLFELYRRGDAQGAIAGYGLGLYICKKIVEAHGGHIGIEPERNQGVEFWFTLPITGTVYAQ